ncbi:MAG: T9SS type A sorting domain-containing protein [Bacteroidia bacterium]|nr:T9SS type A sorting domain-containing protein [Bacteroidia bacterium]
MRYFICNVVFLLILTGGISAQQWLWAERAGTAIQSQEGSERAVAVQTNQFGEVFVVYRMGVNGSPTYGIFYDQDTTWLYLEGEAHVCKYDSAGQRIWTKPLIHLDTSAQWGGSIDPSDMVIDSLGNIYLSGTFSGLGLLFGNDTINTGASNSSEMFVMKFDSNMNPIWIVASSRISPPSVAGSSHILRLALDGRGNVLCTGYIGEGVVFGGDSLIDPTPANGYTPFFAKLDALNGGVIWSRMINSSNVQRPEAICADKYDNVYVGGILGNNMQLNYQNNIFSGSDGGFILKVDSSANFIWFDSTIRVNDMLCKDSLLIICGALSKPYQVDTVILMPSVPSGDGAIVVSDLNNSPDKLLRIEATVSSRLMRCSYFDSIVYAAGNFQGAIYWDTMLVPSSNFWDLVFAEFDLSSNLTWITIASSRGLESEADITTDLNGRIYVCGRLLDSVNALGNLSLNIDYNKDAFCGRIKSNSAFCGFITPYTLQDTALCSNGSIVLSAATGFLSYHWSSGQTTQMINVNSSQIYTYYALDSAGCFYQGPLYNVTVEPEFIIWPSVTGDTLFSSDWYHIQWLLNGAHYASTNDGLIIPTQPGWYCAVDTTNRYYCSDTSNCLYWNPANIEVHSDFEPLVSPNPASEVINVVGENIVQWSIMDMSGRVVSIGTESEDSFSISLVNLTDGIYVLSVYNSQGEVARKKVIVR